MFAITEEQLDGLRENSLRAFCEWLEPRVRARFPDEVGEAGREALIERLEGEVAAARERGLRSHEQLERYADLSFVLGPGFGDRLEWVGTIFEEAGTPGGRLARVEREAVFAAMEG